MSFPKTPPPLDTVEGDGLPTQEGNSGPARGAHPSYHNYVNREDSISPRTVIQPEQSEPTGSSHESIAHILSASWDPFIDRQLRSESTSDQPKLEPGFQEHPTIYTPLLRSKSQPPTRRASEGPVSSNINKFTQNYIIPAAKWAYSPISTHNKKRKHVETKPPYRIEYSVFKPIKKVKRIESEKDLMIHWRRIVEDETNKPFDFPDNHISQRNFEVLVDAITDAIEIDGLLPQRIAQGSSGSYFVYLKSPTGTTRVGIFKPKDEEPYGPLSPKWSKWLHRTFFPCFFGRSCLIPNLGYISEAAACVLDKQLLSYIVPYTSIVYLKSPSFYYSYWDRTKDPSKLPLKIGSLQRFLNGYMDAQEWFKLYPVPADTSILPETSEIIVNDTTSHTSKFFWSQQSLRQFREELEKLVILDYIMRNTDRGSDNWMIKIVWEETNPSKVSPGKVLRPIIKIGAIDSGLSFPWKRPDEWRSFPFGWLFLPLSIIGQPFSIKTRNHYLPLLTSKYWWEQTVIKLKSVFELDNDFKQRMWNRQLAVLKGQAFNVVEILKLSYAGPLELIRRENLLVWDDVMYIPGQVKDQLIESAMESSLYDVGSRDTENNPPSGVTSSLHPIEESLPLPECSNGYEYNVSRTENEDEPSQYEHQSTPVIIERLEKSTGKPPVFTWC